jgi:hypothetical protein
MKRSKTIKTIAGVILLAVITFAFMPAPKKITIKGSDTHGDHCTKMGRSLYEIAS